MENKNTSGGIGFCGLLAIVFIALKLMGFINWSWWWVLAPLWIPPILIIVICILISFIIVVANVPIHFTKKSKKD